MAKKAVKKPPKAAKPKAKKWSPTRSPAGKFNLARVKDGELLSLDKITTVDTFLQTGKSDSYWGRQPCVRDSDAGLLAIFVIRKNGSLVKCGRFSSQTRSYFVQSTLPVWATYASSVAVLVKSSKPKLRKFDLIFNGDEGGSEDAPPVRLEDKSAGITASFDIFTELLAPTGRRISESRILGWLNDGTIQILDSSPDETRKLNPAALRKVSALKEKNSNRTPSLEKLRKAIRPPEAGFTLLSGVYAKHGVQWHRAATILFRHGRKVYIIGQDEGTYFGCELADRPEMIKEAYHSLMPERARKVIGPKRQGEWFAIPVPASKVPATDKCLATFDTSIILSCEQGGNPHSLCSGDGRITPDGVFVRGGCLYHEDHGDLDLPEKQWTTFVRNTAVRSVSREGVD